MAKSILVPIFALFLLASCGKEAIPRRQLQNTMWRIAAITETPVSNEWGTIQCAVDTTLLDVGGIKFGDHSQGIGLGTMAYITPSDSAKVMIEFSWSSHFEEEEYYISMADKKYILDPTDTRKDAFDMYYEETNTCDDVVRTTFSLERIDHTL